MPFCLMLLQLLVHRCFQQATASPSLTEEACQIHILKNKDKKDDEEE